MQRLLVQPGSLLVVDNVLSHADEVADFVAQATTDTGFVCTTVPVGAGLLLAVRTHS